MSNVGPSIFISIVIPLPPMSSVNFSEPEYEFPSEQPFPNADEASVGPKDARCKKCEENDEICDSIEAFTTLSFRWSPYLENPELQFYNSAV